MIVLYTIAVRATYTYCLQLFLVFKELRAPTERVVAHPIPYFTFFQVTSVKGRRRYLYA